MQRSISSVYHSPHFGKAYKKLSPELKKLFKQREIIIRKNIFDPSLKTHKLKGKFKSFWSLSLTWSDRVVFEFIETDSILLLDIGDHRVYQ